MNGIISWKELTVKRRLRFGKARKTYFTFAIGLHLEDRPSAEQVIALSFHRYIRFI